MPLIFAIGVGEGIVSIRVGTTDTEPRLGVASWWGRGWRNRETADAALKTEKETVYKRTLFALGLLRLTKEGCV
jgi:hypothetical protein